MTRDLIAMAREGQLQEAMPAMEIAAQGGREADAGNVAVRAHGGGDLGTKSVEEIAAEIVDGTAPGH